MLRILANYFRHTPNFLMAAASFSLFCVPLQAKSQAVKIKVEIADGRTGKPLRARQLLVGLEHLDTGQGGSVEVLADPGETLQFVDLYSLYRCEVSGQNDSYVNYSAREIADHGLVSKNFCGKAKTQAAPGVLVLYMRHRHSWEDVRDFSKLLNHGH